MKKSYLNAIYAILYIVAIVLLMNLGLSKQEESILTPILVLSLFVLSAATMGYLFVFEPIKLYLDGKKKESVRFFLETLIAFGGITVVIILLKIFVI